MMMVVENKFICQECPEDNIQFNPLILYTSLFLS